MRRVGIYLFYDANGIVDDYVDCSLKELNSVVDYLLVVVNGTLTPEGRKKFSRLASDFFVRENTGYDVTGFKKGIEYIGWDTLKQFDELVITNSSLYGPIYPFQSLFDEMSSDDCDFWGMHTNYKDTTVTSFFGIPLKWGYKPEYISSSFQVFKKQVIQSYEFKQHWENLPVIKDYFEAVVYHEMAITKNLSDAGFTWKTVDREEFYDKCPSPTIYGAYEMISQYNIPMIRKKAFYDPNGTIDYCMDGPRRILQYIKENTNYDISLIWKNLLRTVNLYDLKNWFNLNYIVPDNYAFQSKGNCKIAVVFHSYYKNYLSKYIKNIESFPVGTHIYFTTDTEEKILALKEQMQSMEEKFVIHYCLIENRGRDVSALLVGAKEVILNGNYDLICFMHDKKGIGNSSYGKYSYVGDYYSNCCFENIAPTEQYVLNIIGLFEQNPNLGMLMPPPPRYANYYQAIGGTWTNNYSATCRLLSEMNIKVPIASNKPPMAPYGSVFWFRPDALLPLFEKNWKYTDFEEEPMKSDGTVSHAIERSYGFVAQSQGYYSAIVMNPVYASQELTQMTDIAQQFVKITLQQVGPMPMFKQAATCFAQKLAVIKPTNSRRVVSSLPQVKKSRSPVKTMIRGICPIGLWNLFRRTKCVILGEVYVEPSVKRTPLKAFVRACMPRALWDMLRRAKCRENGWVFVPED
jgi:lipopolysaccharide biosynthesis protein